MSESKVPAPRYAEIFMFETREGNWKARIKLSDGTEHLVCLKSWGIELMADPEARFFDMIAAAESIPKELSRAFGGPEGFTDAG